MADIAGLLFLRAFQFGHDDGQQCVLGAYDIFNTDAARTFPVTPLSLPCCPFQDSAPERFQEIVQVGISGGGDSDLRKIRCTWLGNRCHGNTLREKWPGVLDTKIGQDPVEGV
jgi:hypothetical protein